MQQFRMALSYDPLCWETYGEICSLARNLRADLYIFFDILPLPYQVLDALLPKLYKNMCRPEWEGLMSECLNSNKEKDSYVAVIWRAKNCFDEIAVKDVHIWTALISGYYAPSKAGADILLDPLSMGGLTAA
ncbi:hypothetical protein F2Q70_00043887 [Brassica cretica]|nr:hypothetical protein F2Q70_00043887 [Brassica cretica]KAF2606069.1 hypothetical protein F2Q68_00044900 [Brassica cretica]